MSGELPTISLPPNRQTFYPAEVMELLSISDDTLRGYAEDGTLIAINISRAGKRPAYRYTRESLQNFIAA